MYSEITYRKTTVDDGIRATNIASSVAATSLIEFDLELRVHTSRGMLICVDRIRTRKRLSGTTYRSPRVPFSVVEKRSCYMVIITRALKICVMVLGHVDMLPLLSDLGVDGYQGV
jgi:hypothetical protein